MMGKEDWKGEEDNIQMENTTNLFQGCFQFQCSGNACTQLTVYNHPEVDRENMGYIRRNMSGLFKISYSICSTMAVFRCLQCSAPETGGQGASW